MPLAAVASSSAARMHAPSRLRAGRRAGGGGEEPVIECVERYGVFVSPDGSAVDAAVVCLSPVTLPLDALIAAGGT